ncbi:hypothetical protein ACVWXM_006306 [Bradyrhizobium sp. GM7.3]
MPVNCGHKLSKNWPSRNFCLYVVRMSRLQTKNVLDEYELAIEEIIAACNDDPRDALRALMLLNELLEHRLMRISDQMSDELEEGSQHRLLH